MPVTTGPGKRETITTTLHYDTEYGPVEDRGIRAGDHRDPDLVAYFLLGPSLRMYCNDQAFKDHTPGSGVTPNWHLGGFVMDNTTSRVVMEFEGTPPAFFRDCFERGLAVEGVLHGVDYQVHG